MAAISPASNRPRIITVLALIAAVILALAFVWKPTQRTIEGKTTPLFTDTPENRKARVFGQPIPETTTTGTR